MSRHPKTLLLAAIGASFLLSQLAAFKVGSGPLLNPYLYNMAILVGINIILATSLNLVNGYTGQFSLGHAGFMAIGAYGASAATLQIQLPLFDWPTLAGSFWLAWPFKLLWFVALLFFNGALWSLNALVGIIHLLPPVGQFVASLLFGGALAAIGGLLVGGPSLRLRGDYLAIATLGFGEIIRVVIQNCDPIGGPRGLAGMPQYTNLFWTYALAAVTIYTVVNLVNSTYGRGFLATRDDEVAAEAMGINTTKFKVIAFTIGAFFAGIAGGFYAHYIQFISPGAGGFDFMLSVSIVVMVILGGMGSTVGVTFAALLLTLLPEILRWFAQSALLDQIIRALFRWWLSAEHFTAVSDKTKELFDNRMIFYSLLLIIFMLTRPQGLLGDVNATRRAAPGRSRQK